MAVVVLPDILGALIAQERAVSEIAALTGTRISSEVQDAWDPMPRHAILLVPAGRPPGGDVQSGLHRTRVDHFFYGSTSFEAMRLWRTAHNAICPRQDQQVAFVRTVGGVACRVSNVFHEGGPSRADEPDTGWPRILATYVIEWREVPG